MLDSSNLKPEEIIAQFPEYQTLGAAQKIHLYALDVYPIPKYHRCKLNLFQRLLSFDWKDGMGIDVRTVVPDLKMQVWSAGFSR